MNDFLDGYITAALFAECDDNGAPLDHRFGCADIAAEALDAIKADCDAFVRSEPYRYYVGDGASSRRAGIDFWLTRNGHGAGFWDGDWEDVAGRALTTLSKGFGECSLYPGDDGQLHFCKG